ncbi:22639_t:CDS:2 [Entrophospora sp. SA101]|nr:22639_t:CDS:2 [Entrophospora sp. SA101]
MERDALEVTATAIKIGFRTKEEERGNQYAPIEQKYHVNYDVTKRQDLINDFDDVIAVKNM